VKSLPDDLRLHSFPVNPHVPRSLVPGFPVVHLPDWIVTVHDEFPLDRFLSSRGGSSSKYGLPSGTVLYQYGIGLNWFGGSQWTKTLETNPNKLHMPGPSLLEHARHTADFDVGLERCGGVCWVFPCGGSSPKNVVSHQLTSAPIVSFRPNRPHLSSWFWCFRLINYILFITIFCRILTQIHK